MAKHDQQADGETHEEQLINFLVSTIIGVFGISLGENADLDPEDIHEVLVGTTADGSVSFFETEPLGVENPTPLLIYGTARTHGQ